MKSGALIVGCAIVLFGLQACSRPHGHDSGPGGNHVSHGHGKGGGPPPWAPAHGHRRKTAYRYYQHHEVYYHVAEGEFAWREDGGWKIGIALPPHIRIDLSKDYEVVEFEGDEPWRRPDAPGRGKGKGKGGKGKKAKKGHE